MKLTPEDRSALQGAMNVLTEILQQSPDEVPATLHEWPTDDTHLRGEFWKDRDGDHWRYRNAMWQIWDKAEREWWGWGVVSNSPGYYPPLHSRHGPVPAAHVGHPRRRARGRGTCHWGRGGNAP